MSEIALAQAVSRLGEAVVTRQLDDAAAADLAERIDQLTEAIAAAPPVAKFDRFGSEARNRVAQFLETGEWPGPPPDGSALPFDPISVVGGQANPFSIGASYVRDGDEAVGHVQVGPCFEGPPGRVHGGVICAIFDEVMGSVFRATGTASAFTGELSVRFVGPAPIGEPLEFRAREIRSEGRKRFVEAEATSRAGTFATATAIFVNMKPEHLQTQVL